MKKTLAQDIANISVGDFLVKISLLFAPVALTTPKYLLCLVLARENEKYDNY